MLNRLMRFLLCSVFLIFTSGSFAGYPVTVEQRGNSARIDHMPKRVVVFDLGVLDTLQALDVEVSAVAKGVFPKYLSQYNTPEKAIAGSLFEPDYVQLKKIKPDLIIVAARSRRALPELSKIAPTIDLSISNDAFVAGIKQNIKLLGEIFSKEAQAEKLWQTLNSKITEVQSKAKLQGTGLVLFTIKDKFMPHLPGDRFGIIYDLLGIKSPEKIAPGAPNDPSVELTREEKSAMAAAQTKAYMASQPDWLFILDRGLATGGESTIEDALDATPSVEESTAWQQQHVYYLAPTPWYVVTGGYTSVFNTLNAVNARW